MFRLFRRCPESLAEMRAGVGNFIRAQGKRMREKMQEEKSKSYLDVSVEWVNSVLSLKKLMEKIHENCLDSDMSFHTSILDALNTIINENSNASEIIALYADDSLDKKTRKTEEEISKSLGQAIQLVRFLNDKDVFERYYKQNLAKRLLYDRSMSEDLEREFITKLRVSWHLTSECSIYFYRPSAAISLQIEWKECLTTSS